MRFGIKDEHYAAILVVLSANPRVDRIVLFGSRATWTFAADSDVDVCLHGDRLTLTDQGSLSAALEALSVPQSVDVVLYGRIESEALIERIRREGKLLWSRVAADASDPGSGER
jgi:predicted nucleotidyltransferase